MLIRRMPFAKRSLQVLSLLSTDMADEATVRLIAQRRVAEYLAWGQATLRNRRLVRKKRKPLIGAWERLLSLGQTQRQSRL